MVTFKCIGGTFSWFPAPILCPVMELFSVLRTQLILFFPPAYEVCQDKMGCCLFLSRPMHIPGVQSQIRLADPKKLIDRSYLDFQRLGLGNQTGFPEWRSPKDPLQSPDEGGKEGAPCVH